MDTSSAQLNPKLFSQFEGIEKNAFKISCIFVNMEKIFTLN